MARTRIHFFEITQRVARQSQKEDQLKFRVPVVWPELYYRKQEVDQATADQARETAMKVLASNGALSKEAVAQMEAQAATPEKPKGVKKNTLTKSWFFSLFTRGKCDVLKS